MAEVVFAVGFEFEVVSFTVCVWQEVYRSETQK